MKIKITERSTGKNLTIHSVNRRDFSDYYVTRQGERGPVFDTDDDEIETAIAAAPTKNPAAVALGSMKSTVKTQAARENGKKGGRPRKTSLRDLPIGSIIRLDAAWQKYMEAKVESITTDSNGVITVCGKWISGNHETPNFKVTSLEMESVRMA